MSEHQIRLIKSLYTKQEAKVRTEYGKREWFGIGKGVKQGSLSPLTYSICMVNASIMRKSSLDDKGWSQHWMKMYQQSKVW